MFWMPSKFPHRPHTCSCVRAGHAHCKPWHTLQVQGRRYQRQRKWGKQREEEDADKAERTREAAGWTASKAFPVLTHTDPH